MQVLERDLLAKVPVVTQQMLTERICHHLIHVYTNPGDCHPTFVLAGVHSGVQKKADTSVFAVASGSPSRNDWRAASLSRVRGFIAHGAATAKPPFAAVRPSKPLGGLPAFAFASVGIIFVFLFLEFGRQQLAVSEPGVVQECVCESVRVAIRESDQYVVSPTVDVRYG